MPDKPLLIYDGDCNFCKKWIARWRSYTKDTVDYAPSQEVGKNFPKISLEAFKRSVQLVDPAGKVFSGAEAVFRTLAYSSDKKELLTLYQKLPGFKPVSEWLYALVAKNRKIFSFLTRIFWGESVEIPTYHYSTRVFIRFVGIIYLIAFASLWIQISGLIGENGILPAKTFLETIGPQLGAKKYWVLPTLCWLNSSNLFLNLLCIGGIVSAVLIIVEIAPALALFVCWLFYLSLTTVGRDFLSFQWDILLLETGFLAIFLAPLAWLPKKDTGKTSYNKPVRWLLIWLLFRLMFSSGMAKLVSGDPTWRDFTALTYHYETQPLPTPFAWYFHQLPVWFHRFSTSVMFAIELIIPFFIFTPRRLRHTAAYILIGFQIIIMLTGNYCFFNLLTIALCLLLIDDEVWKKKQISEFSKEFSSKLHWPRWLIHLLSIVILLASLVPFMERVSPQTEPPILARWTYIFLYPLNIVNNYGLFSMMTTTRPEIVVEGSNDRATWLPYEFKYKAGELKQGPKWNEPHQPRLDWQMWFAALGNYKQNAWFINFCVRLLEGRPEVLKLLAKNPFPGAPPKYLRAVVYQYHFTNLREKRETGNSWKREYEGLYCPTLSLK